MFSSIILYYYFRKIGIDQQHFPLSKHYTIFLLKIHHIHNIHTFCYYNMSYTNHCMYIFIIFVLFISKFSPDGSCINEVSIAQSIISQALPALSPRLNLSFSPKTSDRTRLVDSQSYPHNLEMSKIEENQATPENTTQTETNQETELQTPKTEPKVDSNKAQTVVTPSKWPLKPGVLVHVNSNHTLSPKNQARLQAANEESNLGLLERNKTEDKSPPKVEYSKKNGKPRQNVVSGIFKNLRRKSEDSDDDSGKYKKINKSNKRAMSLVSMNRPGYLVQKSRLKSLFQSEKPNIIVTEGGSCLHDIFMVMVNEAIL